jgi:hypothetical protein
MIILAILLPPLYFLLNKKMGMCILTSAMFVVAIFLAITIVLIPGSIILWIIAAIPAAMHCRRQTLNKYMVEHADLIATKMAEKGTQSKGPPYIPPQTIK